MTTRLDLYLTLERVMLALDVDEDPVADKIRDVMDPIWYALSPADRQLLDSRGSVSLSSLHPIRVAAGSALYVSPSHVEPAPAEIRERAVGLRAGREAA